MTTFDEEDEAAMDAILGEHQSAPLKRENSWDSPGMIPTSAPVDCKPKGINTNSFDCDSESGDEDSGAVKVVQPDGRELYYSSFSSAAMSHKAVDCSKIYLAPGIHLWPGGDLRHSIIGTGPECVIEGNEGCGYFFYLRKSNISISNVSLRGTRNGRAHLYVDSINNISVSDIRLEGTYSQCVQILGSENVSVTGCEFNDSIGPSIRVADSFNVKISNNTFANTCSTSPLIVVGGSEGTVISGNRLSSKRVCAFDISSNSSPSLITSDNAVDFG